MAHFKMNNSDLSIAWRNMVGNLGSGFKEIVNPAGLLQTLEWMVTGDGTQDADYQVIATECGYPDAATARAAFDQMTSVRGKLMGDASVTEVNAAIVKMIVEFR